MRMAFSIVISLNENEISSVNDLFTDIETVNLGIQEFDTQTMAIFKIITETLMELSIFFEIIGVRCFLNIRNWIFENP